METKTIRAALAAICVAAAALPSYADTTIAANMTLTADTDWRADGVVTVPAGVTVDLNGHTLWVAGLAGAGTFTSSVAAPSTFDLTTAQTDTTRVKSYTGGTDQALGTEFTFSVQPAWKAFGDFASYSSTQRICTSFTNELSSPIDIVYEFASATAVNSYKIQVTSAAASYLYRAPKTWKFFGSVTGTDGTWFELDSQENVTDWANYELRQFTFFNDVAYKYYRLRISENVNGGSHYGDVLEFFKLEYGRVQNQVRLDLSQTVGFAAASNTVSGTAKFVIGCGTASNNADLRGLGKVSMASNETFDIAGHYLKVHSIDGAGKVKTSNTSTFSDLTTPSAAKTCVTATSGGEVLVMAGNDKYPASAAFDDSTSSSTTGSAENPCHFAYYAGFPAAGIEINYDFGEATYVNRYRVFGSSASNFNVVPKSWAFEGSNDGGTTWTTLDTRTNQSLALNTWAEYTFESSESYSIYRLHTTAVNGSGKFYLFELEYGAVPYNKIYVEASGLEDSDISGIGISGVSMVVAEGSSGVLSGDLDLSGYSAISGTIDLNGHKLTVNSLTGGGTITDSTEFDLTDTDATRVTSLNTFLSSGIASAAFKNYASYNGTGQRVIANLAANVDKMPIRIDYDFRQGTVVNAYRLRVGGNSSSDNNTRTTLKARAPKSFSFWGSNEGGDGEWVKLDERTNETGWIIEANLQEERQYEFVNETPYRHYRIEFYENNGNANLEFFKLEYGNIAKVGKLRVVVPLNNTVDNTSVVLSGNLRLVKEGPGPLVATKANQSYSCGTEVCSGALKCGEDGSKLPFGMVGRPIVVHSGAVMEMNGKINYYNYGFTLDGGTLRNWGGADIYESQPQLKRIWLTADSTLAVTNSATIIGDDQSATTIYLNGYTLATWISPGEYLRFYNTTILDGTLDVKIGGYLVLAGTSGVTATNVDFKATCAMYVAGQFRVRDYEARFYSTGSNMGSNQMTVAGVFKPTVLSYYGCTMLAGSTMDLTAWPGDWPMTSAFGANGKTDLEFANSGEITVNLAGRTDLKTLARSANPRLFTWPLVDGDPVMPGADFVLDPATAAAGFKLRKDATGLRLVCAKGMMLLVR